MNKDSLLGKWEQLKGSAEKEWGKLTKDDWNEIKGDAQILKGKIQERYGLTKEEAEKAYEDFKEKLDK